MPKDGQILPKNLPDVKEFNAELDKSLELLQSLGKSGEDLELTMKGSANSMKTSRDFSKETSTDMTKRSRIGKTILGVIQNQNKGNKIAAAFGKAKLAIQRTFINKQDGETKALLNQFDIQQKSKKAKSDDSNITADLGVLLKNQIPMFKEINMLMDKKKRAAALIGITFGITTKILKSFAARTAVIGKEFGALGMMNKEFKNDILGASTNAKRLGLDTKDVADVVKELTTNFGMSRDEALGLSNQILDTSMALGLSVSETTKLVGSLTEIAGLSFETANNFSKQVGLLAQAKGAAPNAVLKDIANSSETIAKFTGMTPDNLAKAAIQANKLGLQLKDIASSAEGLLSFQDSLNKEIEASILLGRDVNLQKARELALNNDLEGVAIEITKQVGGQAEFEKMNLLQRKALAASIGMSVEQLAKVVSNQDKIRSLNDRIGEQKGFEELVGREGLDNISKIVNDFKTIGADVVNTIGPGISFIAGGIASFTQMLSKSQFLIRVLSGLFAGLAAKSLTTAIGSIFTTFSGIPLGLGIPAAVGVVTGLMSSISSAQKVGDLFVGGQGPILTTPQGESFEGSVRDEVLMAPGISTMVNNNGSGMSKQDMESAVSNGVRGLVEENKKIREQNQRLIAVTERQSGQIIDGLGNLA
jgi:hypothetical protein